VLRPARDSCLIRAVFSKESALYFHFVVSCVSNNLRSSVYGPMHLTRVSKLAPRRLVLYFHLTYRFRVCHLFCRTSLCPYRLTGERLRVGRLKEGYHESRRCSRGT
jgi:hypothetical protein